MNIGTAKPKDAWKDTPHDIQEPDVIDGILHYLLNIARPDTSFTLSEWLDATRRLIPMILHHGRTPIIVGGTMLCIDALIYEYDIPRTTPNDALREDLERLPAEQLYARIITQDPDAAEFIEPHNARRIIRALEVMDATGEKFSKLRTKKQLGQHFRITGIFDGYDTLRERITQRAKQMIQEGLAEEIETLATNYPHSTLLQTMNYKENCDVAAMVQSNMRYAHRQMSWWKRRDDIHWICV